MAGEKKDIWFPAMKYGIGWGLPVAWQGWVVLLTYIIMMIAGSFILKISHGFIVLFVIYALVLTGLLFFICWKKGEKPEVRWGNKL